MAMPGNIDVSAEAAEPTAPPAEPADSTDIAEKESRFMTALQKMMGDTELTEDSMRSAIANLTTQQRQQLLAEGQGLKRDILTKHDYAHERTLYFSEVNRSADEAGMPVDKDGAFLAKKISEFMSRSCEEIPHLYILEAIASSPYLIKAALAEARDAAAASAVQTDLAEIEAALRLLKVTGWCDSDVESRPPFVRRNMLLLHAHLHRERLRALVLAEATSLACAETIDKARRLLDVLLSYCLQVGWVRATLCVTEIQGLITNGLWDPRDDECRQHMRTKLAAVGLKLPKISIQGHCSDVAPGERVNLTVTLSRMHAHSSAEMKQLMAITEQQQGDSAEVPQEEEKVHTTPSVAEVVEESSNRSLAEAFGGEAAALGKEGWWLVVESLRGHLNLSKGRTKDSEPVHNSMVGRQALSPSLDDPQWCADIAFDAPTTPGEYKVVIHVRSSSMIGVDAKRKVSFSVSPLKAKRSLPSSSSGTSTEGTHETMEAMDAAIAEIELEADGYGLVGSSPLASTAEEPTAALDELTPTASALSVQ